MAKYKLHDWIVIEDFDKPRDIAEIVLFEKEKVFVTNTNGNSFFIPKNELNSSALIHKWQVWRDAKMYDILCINKNPSMPSYYDSPETLMFNKWVRSSFDNEVGIYSFFRKELEKGRNQLFLAEHHRLSVNCNHIRPARRKEISWLFDEMKRNGFIVKTNTSELIYFPKFKHGDILEIIDSETKEKSKIQIEKYFHELYNNVGYYTYRTVEYNTFENNPSLSVIEAKELENQLLAEDVNGEDYGIDGLYAALDILTNTIGKVDGYQSDDGILEHKAAITAIKKLYEKKEPIKNEQDQ